MRRLPLSPALFMLAYFGSVGASMIIPVKEEPIAVAALALGFLPVFIHLGWTVQVASYLAKFSEEGRRALKTLLLPLTLLVCVLAYGFAYDDYIRRPYMDFAFNSHVWRQTLLIVWLCVVATLAVFWLAAGSLCAATGIHSTLAAFFLFLFAPLSAPIIYRNLKAIDERTGTNLRATDPAI